MTQPDPERWFEEGDRIFITGIVGMEGQDGTFRSGRSTSTSVYVDVGYGVTGVMRESVLPYHDDPEVRATMVRDRTIETLERGLQRVRTAWWRGEEGRHPSLTVLEDGTVVPPGQRMGHDIVGAVDANDCACDLIRQALHMPIPEGSGYRSNTDLYHANDRQPASQVGRLWAIGAIERALALVRFGALVVQPAAPPPPVINFDVAVEWESALIPPLS